MSPVDSYNDISTIFLMSCTINTLSGYLIAFYAKSTMAYLCHWLEKFEGITLQNWMEKTLEKICYQVMDRHAWIITGTTTTRKQFKEIESRKHSGNVFLCPENEENGAKKHIYYPFFCSQLFFWAFGIF